MLLRYTTYSAKAGSAHLLAHVDLIRWEVHGYLLVEVLDELVCKDGRRRGGGGDDRERKCERGGNIGL